MEFSEDLNEIDFDKICRICIKKNDNLINIFLTQLKMKILSDFIMECAPIQIKIDDQLPQAICSECLNELHRIFNFRTLCVESNEKLLQIFKNRFYETKEIKVEPLESEDVIPGTSDIVNKDDEHKDKDAVDFLKIEYSDDFQDDTSSPAFDSEDDLPLSSCVKLNRKESAKTKNKKGKDKLAEEKLNESHEEYKQDEYGYFRCPHCDDYFKNVRNLQRHVKICLNRIERIKDSLKNDIEKKIVIPFRRTFKRFGPNQRPIEMDSDGNFLCPVCKMEFQDKSKMVRHHLQYHIERKYKCPECGKGFHRLSYLKEHIRSHTNERPNNCEFCGRQFRHAKSLNSHRKMHLEEQKFICTVCNRNFAMKSCLRNHMRTHTGERPFVCEICGKSFNRRHILKTHRMLHTGERPYQCNLCPKKFISKQQLLLHTPRHGLVVEKPENVQN